MFHIRPLNLSFSLLIPFLMISCGLGELGITVTPLDNLITNELGGTAEFTIVLTKKPKADVRINLESSDTTEGKVVPTSVVFTQDNWDKEQSISVIGENDTEDDGDIAYSIITAPAVSNDASYNGLNPPNVTVINRDDDIPIRVQPTFGLITTEDLDSTQLSVVLLKKPESNVTVTAESSNPNEGTVFPSELVFTPSNWNQAQEMTIEGKDDEALDNDVEYQIILSIFSEDLNFNGIINNNVFLIVPVKNIDNEGKLIVTALGDNTTTEDGTKTAEFEVKLSRIPANNATVPINMSVSSIEGSVSPPQVLFDKTNWDFPQRVTVTGQDDFVDDDNKEFFINFAPVVSDDVKFNTLAPAPISFINIDDDTAGINLTQPNITQTTEAVGAGQSTTFEIVLATEPLADVTLNLQIPVDMDGTTEATLDQSSITFNSVDWNSAKTITVTGENDDYDDDNQQYSVIIGAAQSSDTHYNSIDLPDVILTNVDDDQAGITVSPTSGLVTTEGSSDPATFTIALNTKPFAAVSIDLTVSDDTEGRVAGAITHTVTFLPAEWNTPKTIEVTSFDDLIPDGQQSYTIITGLANSTDSKYRGFNPNDVMVTNFDNELDMEMNIQSGTITTSASDLSSNGGGVDIDVIGYTNDLNTTAVAKVPGPVIRTMKNSLDFLIIKINNTHTVNHNFVIDGFKYFVNDSEAINNVSILPTEAMTYKYQIQKPGVFLNQYTHVGNQTKGLFGAVVVEPTVAPVNITADRVWVISDMEVNVSALVYSPNYFLINGQTGWGAMKNTIDTAIEGAIGEKYKIYIVNAGQFSHAMHFHGNHVEVLSKDGNLLAVPEKRHTVTVTAGSTAIVTYEMLQSGVYPVLSQSGNADSSAGVYLNGIVTVICADVTCPQ